MSNTFTPVISDQNDSISLKTTLLSIVAVAGIIGLVIGGALYANRRRQQAVITRYTSETTQLVSEHPAAFKEFFGKTFDDCHQVLTQKQLAEPYNQKSTSVKCSTATAEFATMGIDQLKDSSAIAYLKVSGNTYEMIEASGDYKAAQPLTSSQMYSFGYGENVRTDLEKYLLHQQPILMWQDFLSYISGKEVLVPVVIDGQTVGYMFRGVIER